MHETRTLARFVAETPFDALPREVVDAVRIYVLDDLACGLAGARTPWADMVASLVQETSVGACSMFGRGWTASAPSAALVNGVCIGGFETDHPYGPGSCHPSGSVFPAVLAASQQAGIDGRAFLTAVALGYEALCRVGAAATRAVEDERGFHGPGTNSAIGAAFGASRALGYDAETTVNAVGIAASHGGGLLEFHREGAMTKRLHLGRGAQMGLESALLARRGFTGPSTALEGAHGFLHVVSPSPRPELLLEGLGERWLLLGITLKAFPCHMSSHAIIDAVHRFRSDHPFAPRDVDSVRIVCSSRVMEERFTERAPTSLMGAQYSMPWSAALALCRDAADPTVWTEAALHDPDIARLAASIDLLEAPPSTPGAVADVELTIAGRTHRLAAVDWKGAATNPYSFDDMTQRFRTYAAAVLPPTAIDEVIHRVANLENEPSAAGLARLIAAP